MSFFLVRIKSIASNTFAVDKHTLLQCAGGVEKVHRACPHSSPPQRTNLSIPTKVSSMIRIHDLHPSKKS